MISFSRTLMTVLLIFAVVNMQLPAQALKPAEKIAPADLDSVKLILSGIHDDHDAVFFMALLGVGEESLGRLARETEAVFKSGPRVDFQLNADREVVFNGERTGLRILSLAPVDRKSPIQIQLQYRGQVWAYKAQLPFEDNYFSLMKFVKSPKSARLSFFPEAAAITGPEIGLGIGIAFTAAALVIATVFVVGNAAAIGAAIASGGLAAAGVVAVSAGLLYFAYWAAEALHKKGYGGRPFPSEAVQVSCVSGSFHFEYPGASGGGGVPQEQLNSAHRALGACSSAQDARRLESEIRTVASRAAGAARAGTSSESPAARQVR